MDMKKNYNSPAIKSVTIETASFIAQSPADTQKPNVSTEGDSEGVKPTGNTESLDGARSKMNDWEW